MSRLTLIDALVRSSPDYRPPDFAVGDRVRARFVDRDHVDGEIVVPVNDEGRVVVRGDGGKALISVLAICVDPLEDDAP